MGKMELEVKILNIEEEEFIEKIEKLGATFVEKCDQYLYTYDTATIYGRFIDITTQLNNKESDIKYETAVSKLKLLFFDIDNFLNEEEKEELNKIVNTTRLENLIERDNLLELINADSFIKFMSKFHNNSKKWIRLRQSNNKTTLAVKHLLANDDSGIQQMLETEIEIPSVKEGNALLEALGFSYKSYQEKRRTTYRFLDHDIDIDTWPGIPTFFELEGESKEDITFILEKLGYSFSDAVSCTADDIYVMCGKSQFGMREIKFNK